jgi:hypothetical protein
VYAQARLSAWLFRQEKPHFAESGLYTVTVKTL